MNQLSMKSDIKIFRTRGFNAVSNEFKKLRLYNTFETLYPQTLSKEEYNEVIESHLFIKLKIEKKIQRKNGIR